MAFLDDDHFRQVAQMQQIQAMQPYGGLGQCLLQAHATKPKEESKPDERLLLLEDE